MILYSNFFKIEVTARFPDKYKNEIIMHEYEAEYIEEMITAAWGDETFNDMRNKTIIELSKELLKYMIKERSK